MTENRKKEQTISQHIKRIYADGELTEQATIRKFRIVQTEGIRFWDAGEVEV